MAYCLRLSVVTNLLCLKQYMSVLSIFILKVLVVSLCKLNLINLFQLDALGGAQIRQVSQQTVNTKYYFHTLEK